MKAPVVGTAKKRSVANASALSAVALGVAGVMLGTGVTSTAIGVSDGVTWLPNSGSGEVLQFNPVTGQVEQSVPVGAAGEQITVSQRDGMVVFTNETTHEVSVFDMKSMSPSDKRGVTPDSTMLTSREHMFMVNKGGEISRVDPATASDMGKPTHVEGLSNAVVDEAGTVWTAALDGTIRSFKWSDRSESLRESSSQKVSGLGSDAVLTAHQEGVTVFGPEHGLIAQVGTPSDFGAVTDGRMAGMVPAKHAPSDLVPAALSAAGMIVVVDRGEVRDFALQGCDRPTRPVAFNDVVYAVCEGQSKVVRVNRDGSPAGADIPTAGDSSPILDEGRLLLDVDGGAEGIEVDRKGNDKPYSRTATPVAQVRDESVEEGRQAAADRARADLQIDPPEEAAGNGNSSDNSSDSEEPAGKDVVNGEGEPEPHVEEMPNSGEQQVPEMPQLPDNEEKGNNGRGNEDRDNNGRGNEDRGNEDRGRGQDPQDPQLPVDQDPGNQFPEDQDPGNNGRGNPDPGESESEEPDRRSNPPVYPGPTGNPLPTAPLTMPTMDPSVPVEPTTEPTTEKPEPTKTATKEPTKSASKTPSKTPSKTLTKLPSTKKPTSTKPTKTKTASKTPSATKTTSKKPTITSKPVLKKPTVKASAKGSTVSVSWSDVKADSYTVKVGSKNAVKVTGKESVSVTNVSAGSHTVKVTANKKGATASAGATTVKVAAPTKTATKTASKPASTKPPVKKSVTVSKGARENASYCTTDNCRQIIVTGKGFKPNSTVTCTVRKYDDFADHNVKVNAKGQIPSSKVGLFGYPDKKVSATCDGTNSNTVTW